MKRKIVSKIVGLLLLNSITVLAEEMEPRTRDYPWLRWRGAQEEKEWWYADSDPALKQWHQNWDDNNLIPKDKFFQTLKMLKIPDSEVNSYISFRSFLASQNLETLKALIDVLPEDETRVYPLHVLLVFTILSSDISVERRTDMVDLLIRSGAKVNGPNYPEGTERLPSSFRHETPPPLILAMRKEKLAVAKLLIRAGAEVDRLFDNGSTLLINAVRNRPYFVKLLIDSGADVNKPTKHYYPLLHSAAANGDYLNTKILLDAGAIPTVVDQYDNHRNHNPMHEAALSGYQEIIDIYLERNIFDIDVLDANGCSALYMAVEKRHPDVIRYLLQKGANKNLKSHYHSYYKYRHSYIPNQGMSPLELAEHFKYPEILTAFNEF